ncbi:uncharacterized protein LOC129618328 [Condylostylus longicornis]|uniref:uncharacterized protein LOC129618328 n=1 Tax=Condylostylus longicornis TaxID=2530218 RepID=UPI00244DE009|nr:uncharacterized protein LOC129618328 [Condylostylus longicornis]
MIKMRPYAPSERVAIRADSIDEETSDIEDEVFIRDGRTGKISDENGLKRPLMAPKRSSKTNGKSSNQIPIMKKNRRRCWKCCEPFCYGLAAVTILSVLIFLAALILTMFPIPLQKLKVWLKKDSASLSYKSENFETDGFGVIGPEFVPCTHIAVQRVWMKIFPRMISESPVRKVDLNGDQIDDIVFGFGIDDSIIYENIPLKKCTSARQDEEVSCEGGVTALNGKNGDLIWQRWLAANIFSILCSVDIDHDGYNDCIAAGRGGVVVAINGRNGEIIWNLRELDIETNSPIIIDLYTINLVRDLDGDDIQEILAVHLEERKTSKSGHIKLISGRSGKVIRSIPTPFKEEVFVPIQTLVQQDGTELLLIITGGQNSPGGIYTIRLYNLMEYRSEKEFTPIYQTDFSGFMTPAVITDVTGDQISDIIVASFNSTIFAFDGRNFSMIWNYTFPGSESVSAIVPGHFNHDNVTDFMIKYNTGPGFPVYYYSQTTILNGIDGQPIMGAMMLDSGGPNSLLGGVSISQTSGGDFFLHWQVQCRGKLNVKDSYEFIPESDVILQARADTCLLRYNTTTVLKLYAITRHIEPPGAVIFSSDDIDVKLNKTELHKVKQNTVSPLKHPKMLKKLLAKEYLKTESELANSLPHKGQKKVYKENGPENSVNPIIEQQEKLRERYRKPLYPPKSIIADELAPVDDEDSSNFENAKPFIYPASYNIPERNGFKEYDGDPQSRTQDEYPEILYNDIEQQQPIPPQLNERPIRLRSKYPGNRDVRSEITSYDKIPTSINRESLNITSDEKSTSPLPEKSNSNNDEPVNLWDIELEKEEEEALKESHKYEYSLRQRRQNLEQETEPSVMGTFKEESDLFLASISSTGVLVDSLDKSSNSTIDYAFVINVRESETYPPLLLQEDINCIEEKMSSYNTISNADLQQIQKQVLEQCLKSRLGTENIQPGIPRYESQVVVIKISIACSCHNLQPGEICSKLEKADQQKWTQFMGNYENGFYKN